MIRRIRALAVDLGFSGWLWHRYEIWICVPTEDGRRTMSEFYDNNGRKFTRQAGARAALGMTWEAPYRIELVDLGSGRHEVVKESVPAPTPLTVRPDLLAWVDARRPNPTAHSKRYLRGWDACRDALKAGLDKERVVRR